MDNLTVKGDEVRHGTLIYLDALTKDLINTFSDQPLSEPMLNLVNDGSVAITPISARQVAQQAQGAGELVFALRLRSDQSCIGVCRLSDVSWNSRHARLHINVLDETRHTVETLADSIQTVLQFAYWEANLNRIDVHCIEDNQALRDALEQAGFTSEGQLRQEVYRSGRYLDIIIYSMLQREWSG